MNKELVQNVITVVQQASSAILSVYNDNAFAVEVKADASPLTAADIAAHKILLAHLPDLLALPVLSEESAPPSFKERQSWESYWLIDPLDGTKEFVERNGEFTVNVALIHEHYPVLGVVMAPVTGEIYWGAQGLGAYKYSQSAETALMVHQWIQPFADNTIRIAASRRHGNEALETLIANIKQSARAVELRSMGSSLKFCRLAEGQVDIYPRYAPTSEWDTAAAQAVVEAAGGMVVDLDLQRLAYNTKSSLLNPHFYALAGDLNRWRELLEP